MKDKLKEIGYNVAAGLTVTLILVGILAAIKIKYEFPALGIVKEVVVFTIEALGFHQLGKIILEKLKK